MDRHCNLLQLSSIVRFVTLCSSQPLVNRPPFRLVFEVLLVLVEEHKRQLILTSSINDRNHRAHYFSKLQLLLVILLARKAPNLLPSTLIASTSNDNTRQVHFLY